MASLAHFGAANAIKDFSRVATGRGSCRCEVMRPQISFQPIEVLTASEDREGRLVLVDGNLVAVLVRLSDPAHDPLLRGAWYIEAGFGLLDGRHEMFASLEEAAASIERDFS